MSEHYGYALNGDIPVQEVLPLSRRRVVSMPSTPVGSNRSEKTRETGLQCMRRIITPPSHGVEDGAWKR